MTLDPERRTALMGIRLRGLATGVADVAPAVETINVAGGVAMVDPTPGRACVWFLASDDHPERALGHVLLLSARHGITGVAVCFDDAAAASVAARRATALEPSPLVWVVDGRSLRRAEPAPALPLSDPPEAPEGFIALCVGAGVEPVVEHGIWRGEVLGLEVVRTTVVGTEAGMGAGIEVGVGRFDREAGAILHGDLPPTAALSSAADLVRRERHAGAGAHPLAGLVRERWLRRDLMVDPSPLGLVDLVAVDPADVVNGLREPSPTPAIGSGHDGERVLVVCSVGVDPRVVPAAADLVLRERPDRLIVVVPERDVHPALVGAVERLAVPAGIVGVTGPWS